MKENNEYLKAREYLISEGLDPDQLAAEGVEFVNNIMNSIKDGVTHELKTWPEYFESVYNGSKTFEVRKNDRHFKNGDMLILKEWNSVSGYSGREIKKRVTYVFLGGNMGIMNGYCVLGLGKVYH